MCIKDAGEGVNNAADAAAASERIHKAMELVKAWGDKKFIMAFLGHLPNYLPS